MPSDVVVEIVDHCTEEVVRAVATLLPQLSDSASFDESLLAAVVAHPTSLLFVARRDGSVVGMTTLVSYPLPSGRRAHVDDVVVAEEARGHGVGEALLRRALEHARTVGARSVELTSRPSRESAVRLYERIGFVRRDTGVYRYTPPSASS